MGRRERATRISDDDVRAMRADRQGGMSVDDVFIKWGPKLGISHDWVRRICAGVARKDVA